MNAYFVIQLEGMDEEGRAKYLTGLTGVVEKFGGRHLISSPTSRAVEGKWKPGRLVVIEFPFMKSLTDWYEAPEYGPLLELRLQSARSDPVVVGGIDHTPR